MTLPTHGWRNQRRPQAPLDGRRILTSRIPGAIESQASPVGCENDRRRETAVLNESDPLVQFKLEILERAMPADSAIVFGDMYIVDGGYTAKCLEFGCERAVLVDSLETPAWLERRLSDPRLDFYKGDFSDPLFMHSIRERYAISVVFDVLLHQPPLLSTLHLMLEKTKGAVAIVQPVLEEQDVPNVLVYLPGQPPDSGLYPLSKPSREYRAFDVHQVNQSHWIWGMTPSLIRSVLLGEGFEVVHEASGGELENPRWMWWGAVARRVGENAQHWSRTRPTPGTYSPEW
jgi:hypothetical protein